MKRLTSRFLMTVLACAAGASIPATAQNPAITALNPPARTAGAAGSFTLTLTGTNFCTRVSTVSFNGTSRGAVVNGAGTSAAATITAAEVATMGTVPVTLSTGVSPACPSGGGLTSAPFNFTINPPLTLTPAGLPGGSVGSPYNQTLTASGGTPPYSAPNPTGTSVPPFTNGPGTVSFSFTPPSATSYNFNVAVTDNGGGNIGPAYGFTVSQPSVVAASQGTPQAATVGTAFGTALQVSVLDGNARPIQGTQVTFTPPVGGATGSFSGSNIVFTDVNGLATAPAFTANTVAGSYVVTAAVAGTSTTPTFNLTNMSGAANNIVTVAGTPQSATINTTFATILQAGVRDAFGNAVQGVSVTFAAPGSGASGAFVNSPTVPTNAAGVATAPAFNANGTAGGYTVTATAAGVGTPANFSLTNTAGPPASIAPTAGTPQSTAAGAPFATTLQAIVRDAGSNPVAGVSVTFAAPPGSGASGVFGGPTTVTTTAGGLAIAPSFTANATAGSYAVTAIAVGVGTPASFSLTNNAGSAASITMSSGGGQSTQVTTQFEVSLQALVRDANSNPVQGVNVTFVAPGSGASGTFGGVTTVATGVNGIATAPAFTANTKAGTYNVTATAVGVGGSAGFSLTNTPGPPVGFTATGGTPQSSAINTAFATALQATVTDNFGNGVSGIQVNFSAPNLDTNLPFPSGRFGASIFTSVNTNASGVAIAPTFTANGTAGAYAVVGSANFTDATLNFNLTNTGGTPTSITVFAGSPQSVTVNTAFATALQAIVKDANSNPVPNVAVTFAAPGSGAGGAFTGSATVQTNASGVATAPVFTANTTSGAYAVTASTNGVGTPASFSLTNNPGVAAGITATGGTPQSTNVTTAFPTLLQATVKDSFGNPVPNAQVTFSTPTGGATGSFATPATVNTNSSGVAAAPRFTANSTVGSYAVTALVAGVNTPANFSLTNSPGAPATITATGGTPQSTLAATQYPATLQATVKDASGNPVPNAQVTFTLPPQGPTATFAGGQSTAIAPTNASGVAASPVFNANAGTGPYNATATVPGVATPALFSLNNTANSSITTSPGLAITTTQLPPGTVGASYSSGVTATGGVPPYSFTIGAGSLPPGLFVLSAGSIAGTPTAPGTQSFGVQVTDSTGASASRGFTLNVANALIITTASNLPNGTLGQSYAVSFQATGGLPPYSWSIPGGGVSPADDSSTARLASASAGLPPGLTFSSGNSTGTLSGTLTALGNFTFTVEVTDTANRVAFKTFAVASLQPGTPGTPTGPPGLQVSQMGLDFQGPQGGNPPPPQYLSIVATNGQPLLATITLDSGSTGTPAPPWLKARFVSATTPARLAVQVVPTGLTAGAYKGRVLVSYQGQPTIVVNVSFTIDLTPPSLAVAPGFLRFTAISGGAATAQQALLVSNLGTGGPLNFTAVSDSQWLTVTPASGTTVVGSGVPLQVAVNTQALPVGAYLGKITVAGPVGGSVDVPVSLFVSPTGPAITVTPVGVRFDARAGNGLAIPLPVTVLDSGTGTVNWTADLLAGQNWLTLSPAAGQSTPTASSQLTAAANPAGLAAGAYYGLIRISDPQSLNSPQYATVVLNVQPATVGPDAAMEPGGLFFTAAPGGSSPGPQALKVFVSSDTPVAFQAAASTDDGGSWLSIGQQTGTSSTQTPAQITVSVNPAGLKTGVYTGDVSVSFSSQIIRTANITLVVLEAGGIAASSSTAPSAGKDRGASCAPSQLSLTSTSLVNAFASPAGWPTPLIVRATDDCGNGASSAQVVATFSNGDPPLNLSRTDPAAALFSGTWAPKNTASQMTVTVTGLALGLAPATARLTGTVGSNIAPSLSPNGTLNNLNPAPGAAVAPGTVAQVYGGSLTPSTTIPGLLPLPTLFNGTSVLVGAYLAPLYSLSDGQIDVQIPAELTPNRQYSILVSSGAAFTLPDTLTTTDVSPGLLNFAQHADFSTISASSPATAGETILLYLVGMGATNPAVASGAASPAPPANVSNPPAVTINGQSAAVSFAGLTPGLVGLYQINVQVPNGTPSGSATVTVTQNNAVSNTVTVPIQ